MVNLCKAGVLSLLLFTSAAHQVVSVPDVFPKCSSDSADQSCTGAADLPDESLFLIQTEINLLRQKIMDNNEEPSKADSDKLSLLEDDMANIKPQDLENAARHDIEELAKDVAKYDADGARKDLEKVGADANKLMPKDTSAQMILSSKSPVLRVAKSLQQAKDELTKDPSMASASLEMALESLAGQKGENMDLAKSKIQAVLDTLGKGDFGVSGMNEATQGINAACMALGSQDPKDMEMMQAMFKKIETDLAQYNQEGTKADPGQFDPAPFKLLAKLMPCVVVDFAKEFLPEDAHRDVKALEEDLAKGNVDQAKTDAVKVAQAVAELK